MSMFNMSHQGKKIVPGSTWSWFDEYVMALSEPKNLNDGDRAYVFVERQDDGHQQWLACDVLTDPKTGLEPSTPNIKSLPIVMLDDSDEVKQDVQDNKWPKFRAGDRVRLFADEDHDEEFGNIKGYEGHGMYIVTVDDQYLIDSHDDGLREVDEDQLELAVAPSSGLRRSN